jgi:putative CocE/NonD family hydrolase
VPEAYHPLLTAPHSVRYFNLQQETWRHDHTFPVPDGVSDSANALSLFLGCAANGSVRSLISPSPFTGEHGESRSTLSVDPSRDIGSVGVSRYHAMTQLFDRVTYSMQDSRRINHLRYTSPPLSAPLDVSGFVVVSLWVSSSVDDAALFVYLEAVDKSGKGYYVTEGMIRASNRIEEEPSPDNILHFPSTSHTRFINQVALAPRPVP